MSPWSAESKTNGSERVNADLYVTKESGARHTKKCLTSPRAEIHHNDDSKLIMWDNS